MNYSFYDFMMLIGSLGLFLFGMKTMSEGLQKAAGNKLRSILTAMTKNRFTAVLTGVFITALIQSSSATTVMVVSFVNAGLLNLLQSVTVIMGANIGTTITAWIISFFGFKFSIAAYSIPMIAIATPLLFSAKGIYTSVVFMELFLCDRYTFTCGTNVDCVIFFIFWHKISSVFFILETEECAS